MVYRNVPMVFYRKSAWYSIADHKPEHGVVPAIMPLLTADAEAEKQSREAATEQLERSRFVKVSVPTALRTADFWNGLYRMSNWHYQHAPWLESGLPRSAEEVSANLLCWLLSGYCSQDLQALRAWYTYSAEIVRGVKESIRNCDAVAILPYPFIVRDSGTTEDAFGESMPPFAEPHIDATVTDFFQKTFADESVLTWWTEEGGGGFVRKRVREMGFRRGKDRVRLINAWRSIDEAACVEKDELAFYLPTAALSGDDGKWTRDTVLVHDPFNIDPFRRHLQPHTQEKEFPRRMIREETGLSTTDEDDKFYGWVYYPKMTMNDVLLFTQFDSETMKKSGIFHAAISSNQQTKRARQSIEARLICVSRYQGNTQGDTERFGISRTLLVLALAICVVSALLHTYSLNQ